MAGGALDVMAKAFDSTGKKSKLASEVSQSCASLLQVAFLTVPVPSQDRPAAYLTLASINTGDQTPPFLP